MRRANAYTQLAAPKSKYVEHILVATHAGEAGVAEIFRALTNRLRDSAWTIVFKSLIIVHLMIREGEPEVTLKYLAQNPTRKLAINSFTEGTFLRFEGSTAAMCDTASCYSGFKEGSSMLVDTVLTYV